MTKVEIDLYRQDLAIRIVEELARIRRISIRQAADLYYRSRLCDQIAAGLHGIDNLDYKYLVGDLIENEPEIFQ